MAQIPRSLFDRLFRVSGNDDDVYRWQRLALKPWWGFWACPESWDNRDRSDCQEVQYADLGHGAAAQQVAVSVLQSLEGEERTDFLAFLDSNTLVPLWFDAIGGEFASEFFGEQNAQEMRRQTMLVAGRYLRQKQSLLELAEMLDQAGIVHAVLKGAHCRELIYERPALRPSCDIDLLVLGDDMNQVIQLFVSRGYTLHTLPQNLSHEVTLRRGDVSVDLHYHILRPGRIPENLTATLLNTRLRCDGFWGLPATEALMVLLVHPVITKYSDMTEFGLIRMVDLLYWFAAQQKIQDRSGNARQDSGEHVRIDWTRLAMLLKDIGLLHAAWVSLRYLHLFGVRGLPEEASLLQSVGRRSRYLERWLRGNLPARLSAHPWLVQFAFTLFVHDRFSLSARFLLSQLKRRFSGNPAPFLLV